MALPKYYSVTCPKIHRCGGLSDILDIDDNITVLEFKNISPIFLISYDIFR